MRFGDAHRFLRDAAQLVEERRVRIGLVVSLVSDGAYGDESTADQASKLTLHGARSSTRQRDQLGRIVTAGWLAEEEPEHALLRAGKQCIREGRAKSSGRYFRSDDRFHTQNGNDCTQTEYT